MESPLETTIARNIPVSPIWRIIIHSKDYLPGKGRTSSFLILPQLLVARLNSGECEGELGDSLLPPPCPPSWERRIHLGGSSTENIGALAALSLAQGAGFPCWERQAKESWGYSQIDPHPHIQLLKQGCHPPKKLSLFLPLPYRPAQVCQRDKRKKTKRRCLPRDQNTSETKFQNYPFKGILLWFNQFAEQFMTQRRCWKQ